MGERSTAVNPRHTQRTQGKGAAGDREPSGSPVGPSMSETWVILESHVDGGAGVGGSMKQQGAQVMAAGLAFSSLVCKLWTSWAQQVGSRVGGISICFSTLIFCLLSAVEDLVAWSLTERQSRRDCGFHTVKDFSSQSPLPISLPPTGHFLALPASQFSSSTK